MDYTLTVLHEHFSLDHANTLTFEGLLSSSFFIFLCLYYWMMCFLTQFNCIPMMQFLQRFMCTKNWLFSSLGFYNICSANKSRKQEETFKSDTNLTSSLAQKQTERTESWNRIIRSKDLFEVIKPNTCPSTLKLRTIALVLFSFWDNNDP